jgi:cytochrome c biogenesis factor
LDKTNKVLASLNYFSVFFAPFLLPIAIYFIVDHIEVRQHAKKALVSHIIPFLSILAVIGMIVFSGFSNPSEVTFLTVFFGGFLVVGLINLIVFIWNIVKGIKLLTTI